MQTVPEAFEGGWLAQAKKTGASRGNQFGAGVDWPPALLQLALSCKLEDTQDRQHELNASDGTNRLPHPGVSWAK